MSTGIYKITNLVNNKLYVGSSTSLSKRRNTQSRVISGKYRHTKNLFFKSN